MAGAATAKVTKGATFTFLAFLIAFAFGMAHSTAYAVEGVDTNVKVGSTNAAPGDTVQVPVVIEGNPGILGAVLQITYDDGLNLVNATNGNAFAPLSLTKPGSLASPCKFTWDGVDIEAADVRDGEILVLTFEVSESVASGTALNVVVSIDNGAFLDRNLNGVPVACSAGSVSVADFMAGDLDGDKIVNSRDVIFVRRHIVGGYEQRVNVAAADVNNDLKVDSADVILMRRYIAGGYGVELKQSRMKVGEDAENTHEHDFAATAAHSPTCTEDGNIAYWHCESCGKYFNDPLGQTEIQAADIVVAATGHTPVVDAAVAPTRTTTGLTEGSHCSICNEIIIQQQIVPALEADEYFITYDVANGDSYLASQSIANPNKTSYYEGDSFKLSNLSAPGYRFLGWYDGAGDDAEKIARVEATTAEDLELYAHWEAVTYTVQYESDLFLDTNSATYTVDKGLVLPTPKLSNYIFAGWTDNGGTSYGKKIPMGTTGNISLTANWTSERNKTYTNPNPCDPIVTEDEDNNVILFAYEIGRIENVPCYEIKNFGYISGDGVTRSATETYSQETSQGTMEQLSNVVANATTNSSNWTLSSDWNETTSVSEEWCKENGYTREEAETVARSDSSNWNISNSKSGSDSCTSSSSSSDGWSNEIKNTGSNNYSSTNTLKTSAELSVGFPISAVNVGVKGGVEATNSSTSEHKSGFEISGSQSQTGESSQSSSHTSGWNSSSSYGGSSTTSRSNTVSTALSEKISQKTGYGKSYSHGGSETQGFASSDTISTSDSYTSSVTYNTAKFQSVTSSWTTAATKPGYHRWVVAGTAHVYGVVGYDIESKSFFVYTFSVMDDETHEFEDYSYTTAAYNDNENGVISFEVPYNEIMETVANRVYASDGLRVDLETGKIVGYTGTDTCVVIPEYFNAGNGDVVKITGFTADAFRGNKNLVTVVLSDFITEIPDNAFNGCTSLAFLKGGGVTSIGNSAFAGCASMENCGVYSEITHLGSNCFEGADHLYVGAANSEVTQAAISAGAKSLTLDLQYVEDDEKILSGTMLTVPSTIDYFELNGGSRAFDGLKIDSNAGETVLNKVTITGDSSFPVKISSEKVVLNQSNISSPGIALALTADTTELGLRGTTMVSSIGENALLSKNLNLYETADNVVGKLVVPQKALICGSIHGAELLDCNQVININQTTFDNMLNPYKLTFDANGGTCEEKNRDVYNGAAIGELPIPSRDYYTFNGWYLNGANDPVTAETVLPVGGDQTLIAGWTENPASDWVKAADLPEGAQVLDRKWTYNLSVYKKVAASYTYYRWCTYYDNMWCQDSCWMNGGSQYHEITVNSPLASQAYRFADTGGNAAGICGPYSSCSHKREGQSFWWLKSINYKDVLDRVENKESTSMPTGSNISNVQEWVQYRSKTSDSLTIATI